MLADAATPGLTLDAALRQYGSFLTIYEKKEIEDYKVVYYAGQKCSKKIKAPTAGPNDGYDNTEGEYHFVTDDHIAYRYQIDCLLGVGAFGQVLRARDHVNNTFVAIKLIRNKKKIAQQSKEEIRILQHINDKDVDDRYGLVRMHEHFQFRGHVCIVYELLGENLYDEMKANDFFPMSLAEVRTVAARMLVSLTFLWREGIIHADLKPENVLRKCSNSSIVKVADLGSACYDGQIQYSYIQSRFYRAPEIILGNLYGKPIDLWSYGCILCELATGYPLFPGENERDQLACIMEYLDVPPKELLDRSRRKQTYFASDYTPKIEPTSKGRIRKPGSRTLHQFLGLEEDDEFVGFLLQFLAWDPSERVPPREAMKHPWIREEFVFDRSKVPPAPPLGNPHPQRAPSGERPARPSGPTRTLVTVDLPRAPPPAEATQPIAPLPPPASTDDDKARQAAADTGDDSVSNSTTRLKRPVVAANKARSIQVPVVIPEQVAGCPRDATNLPSLTQPTPHQTAASAVPVAARRSSGDTAKYAPAAPAPAGRVAAMVQRLDNGVTVNAATRSNGTSNGTGGNQQNLMHRASAQPVRSAAEPTVRARSLVLDAHGTVPAAPTSKVVPATRNGVQTSSGSGGVRQSGVSSTRDSATRERSNSPFYSPSGFYSSRDAAQQPAASKPSPAPVRPSVPPSLQPKAIAAPRRERRVDLAAGDKTGVLVKELSPSTRRRAQARVHRISETAIPPDMTDVNSSNVVFPVIR